MIELKVEKINDKLEKHYAEDENGVKYYILQLPTCVEYAEAIDVVPCRYTYKVTDKIIEEIENGNNTNI